MEKAEKFDESAENDRKLESWVATLGNQWQTESQSVSDDEWKKRAGEYSDFAYFYILKSKAARSDLPDLPERCLPLSDEQNEEFDDLRDKQKKMVLDLLAPKANENGAQSPTAIFLAGHSFSGKSQFLREFLMHKEAVVHVNRDDCAAMLLGDIYDPAMTIGSRVHYNMYKLIMEKQMSWGKLTQWFLTQTFQNKITEFKSKSPLYRYCVDSDTRSSRDVNKTKIKYSKCCC